MKIDSRWKWAAKAASGEWWLYTDKPTLGVVWKLAGGSDYFRVPDAFAFPECDWQDSLHQIIDGELVKYCDAPEPPAVTRAREILEECGIVDVQGTPADQLRPLVEVIEGIDRLKSVLRERRAQELSEEWSAPDAIFTVRVNRESNLVFTKSFTLEDKAVFNCYLVKGDE